MAKNENKSRSVTVVGERSRTEPYALPEGWKWTQLDELSVIPITDGTHQTPTYSDAESGIPFISAKDVTKEYIDWSNIKYITKELHNELYKRIAPQIDDILLAKNGTTGVAAIVDVEKVFDLYVTLAVIRPNQEKILPRYLFRVINSPICKNQFDEHLTGIGVPNLHLRDIKVTQIPLPPTLAEQKRIVSRIESLFTKLDEAKDKAQSVVDGFELRRAAILHKAFTNQLKIDNGELKDEDWEEKTFSELGTANLGKMLDAKKNAGDDVQYLRNVNVRWFGFDLSDLMTMKAKPEEIKKLSVKKGDLFICEGGEPGRCAVWKNEDANMIFQKAIHRFRPNENVSSDFIAYEFSYLNQIGKLSEYFTGTTIKHLTGQSLAKIPIKLPPLNYQLSIVNFLDSVLEKEADAKETAERVLSQIDLLKKSILARAFRGEL